jgi:hypothetical protein
MRATEGVDPERSTDELGSVDARRGREQQAAEEPVEVADGDAEVRDHDVARNQATAQEAAGLAAAGPAGAVAASGGEEKPCGLKSASIRTAAWTLNPSSSAVNGPGA